MAKSKEQAEIEEMARGIGGAIGSCLPPSVGFALVLFGYRAGDVLTYLSSAERPGMIVVLKDLLARLEGQEETGSTGDQNVRA